MNEKKMANNGEGGVSAEAANGVALLKI